VLAVAQPLAAILWNTAMGTAVHTPEARAAQEQGLLVKVGQIKHPTVQHYYKQYVRDRLREAQAVQYQKRPPRDFKNYGGKKPDGFNSSNYNSTTPLPPIMRTADTSLLFPASNLIALVIACPSLLMDGAAEEFWLHAPMPAAWQQQLHHLITELHIESPQLVSESLWQTLNEEAPAESLANVLRAMDSLGIALTHDDTIRQARAQRLWGEVINDVDRARLRGEYAEAEAALTQEMNDETLNHFMAIKQQLEALERERSRFYREDPLPAVQS
jgi:hypothetical protein